MDRGGLVVVVAVNVRLSHASCVRAPLYCNAVMTQWVTEGRPPSQLRAQ